MDHALEQELELQALESLFCPEREFSKHSENAFSLHLEPYAQAIDSKCYVKVTLNFTYAPKYPNEPPEWFFAETKGLDGEQFQALETLIKDSISTHLGSPMIYEIALSVQEYLTSINHPPQSNYDQMMSRAAKRPDATLNAPENSLFAASHETETENFPQNYHETTSQDDEDEVSDNVAEGATDIVYEGIQLKDLCPSAERITEEQFLVWRVQFKQEMVKKGVWKDWDCPDNLNRRSGRQIFERSSELDLMEPDDEGDETRLGVDDDTTPEDSVLTGMKIDTALFDADCDAYSESDSDLSSL